jgi:hypothetical protein
MAEQLKQELPSGLKNTTDYDFPPWWGRFIELADDEMSQITHADAYDRRHRWLTHQRNCHQLQRQYNAGVHDGFDRGMNTDDPSPIGETEGFVKALMERSAQYEIGTTDSEEIQE